MLDTLFWQGVPPCKKKPRGGGRLIELAIFGVLVLVVAVVLVFVTGMTSISAFFSPAAPTARPIAIAGGLPTPAPTITRTPAATPTIVATPMPVSAPAATPMGSVLLISYLRTDPRVADDTRQAILCPDDSVEYMQQQTVEDLVWYRVRVAQLAADCNAGRAPVGTEGWASSNVVSAPSGPVAVAAR